MTDVPEKVSRRALLRKAAVLVGVVGTTAFAASCQPVPPPAPPPPPPPPPPRPLRGEPLVRGGERG